jgi:hypothetical protein
MLNTLLEAIHVTCTILGLFLLLIVDLCYQGR